MTKPIGTTVRTPGTINVSVDEEGVLQRMFAQHSWVTIEAEFGMGLSGCRVFRIRPVAADGTAHTPALVKIGPIELIEQEWQAYEAWVKNRLPRIAWVTSQPIIPAGSEWGGLRCELVGGGIFEVQSLSQYYRQASAEDVIWVLQKRLFPVMGRSWWFVNRAEPTFRLQSDYDRLLPINLMMAAVDPQPGLDLPLVSPERGFLLQAKIGDRFRLQGFQVTELDAGQRQLTLNLPHSPADRVVDSFRFRVQGTVDYERYQIGDLVESIEATVIETRHSLLEEQARNLFGEGVALDQEFIPIPDGTHVPNPLLRYQKILHDTFLEVNLSTVHGDFNLENILVDPDTRDVTVIDFATVRQGHALHDLLRIETEIITKLIPEALAQGAMGPEVIRPFYYQLHQAAFGRLARTQPRLPHRSLEKPFDVLIAVRQEARQCFFNQEDHTEYYHGLFLYLLGALKFGNLDAVPQAKALAFFGAATIIELLSPGFVQPKRGRAFRLPRLRTIHVKRLLAATGIVVFLVAILFLIIGPFGPPVPPIPVEPLCELDRRSVVELTDGPNRYNDLPAYFADANSNLYQHISTVEAAYLDGTEHRGLTYIWGAPGVGKSFVSRNRLREGFPGESCVVKLGDLFGDDSNLLNFEVVRKPDLATVDGRLAFDNLPTAADTSDYDLASLLKAANCQLEDSLVPLVIVDDIDEVHTESSDIVLRSLDRLVLDSDPSAQPFLHVMVLGRTEGFGPWYQDSKRNDDISPYLNTYWLNGPEYQTFGDVEFLAINQNAFTRGVETWDQMTEDGRATAYVDGYVRAVSRHPMLTYSIRTLAVATMITDRAVTNPDDTEFELKSFLFDELLRRAANVHGRPSASNEQYRRLIEEIAVKYAAADQIDEAGFFNVAETDTVPVFQEDQPVAEVFVRDVLDHSGIAVLEPASHSSARYRFDPVWVHAHLVELHNQRLNPDHVYQTCYQ